MGENQAHELVAHLQCGQMRSLDAQKAAAYQPTLVSLFAEISALSSWQTYSNLTWSLKANTFYNWHHFYNQNPSYPIFLTIKLECSWNAGMTDFTKYNLTLAVCRTNSYQNRASSVQDVSCFPWVDILRLSSRICTIFCFGLRPLPLCLFVSKANSCQTSCP